MRDKFLEDNILPAKFLKFLNSKILYLKTLISRVCEFNNLSEKQIYLKVQIINFG